MKNCILCGMQNSKNAKFCSGCGNRLILDLTEQENEHKNMVADALNKKLNSIKSGLFLNDLDQFKVIVKEYRKQVYDLIQFQEENFDSLIDEFISRQHVIRDYNYYKTMIKYGKTFDEIIDEEEIIKDLYFTKDQIKALRSLFYGTTNNEENFNRFKGNVISVNRLMGKTYSQKKSEFSDNANDYIHTELLEIADAALAFLSPVSAARYVIKKMKDNE